MKNKSMVPLLAVSAGLLMLGASSCSSAPSTSTPESAGSVAEQLSTLGIATWKNDALGAYTIHHDDAGAVPSLTDYIIPQLNSRGLTAGLGAIVAEIQANSAEQLPQLRAAAAAGHEIMSHSWTHVPSGNTQYCPGVTMVACGGGLGGQVEVVDSKSWLETNLNTQVNYFIYPYDYRASDVAALVAQKYLGDRSGWGAQGAASGVNSPTSGDYNNAFETPGADPIPDGNLNRFVDQIMSWGGWGIRELHGVGDDTWGHVTQAQYITHLDYIKAKRDAGQLWVANPTAVIKYKHVRQGDCGTPTLTNGVLAFSNRSSAACGKYHTVVSVKIDDSSPALRATQGGINLEVLNKGGNKWIVNLDPALGDATLSAGCVPETDVEMCTRLAKSCGSFTGEDNCGAGRTVSSCGTCTAPDTCGGGGIANACGVPCIPETDAAFCVRQGKNCGRVIGGDNCDAFRVVNSCGTCTAPALCGARVTNVCGTGCTPESDSAFCARQGKNCGAVGGIDNCGVSRYVDSCGTCPSPTTCGGTGANNVCGGTGVGGNVCAPPYDQSRCTGAYTTGSVVSVNQRNYSCANPLCQACGSYPNCEPGASGCHLGVLWVDSGACGSSACTPETNAAFCARQGKNCGSVTAADNCGTTRTVSSCGTCTSPATCGGTRTPNVCGAASGGSCFTPYSRSKCLSYWQGTKVSFNRHNYTCSNSNCANCAGYASCAPGASGCPWGKVWTDNGTCN